MATLRLRIDFEPRGSIGIGKITLLERIRETGSISAAARSLGMSYRRAWLLIDDMNQLFREPVISSMVGGSGGGGAALTEFGAGLVARYRLAESQAHAAVEPLLAELQAAATGNRDG